MLRRLVRRVLLAGIVLAGGYAGSAGAASVINPATGSFDAQVNFETIRLDPVGANCRLTVDGVLVFSGAITGEATGTTGALILAPCGAVATNPPGTYRDVFRFVGRFEGEIAGEAVSAQLVYAGVARPGGEIDAVIRIRGVGVSATLEVDAVVAQAGTYEGAAVVRRR